MPLQIRRGSNADRQLMATPLATGELLYVTDQQKLYIGDGATLGGIAVTGFNAEDAIDAIGAALVAGTHQNIEFTYDTVQDIAGRIDATVSVQTLLHDLDLNSFDITGAGSIVIGGGIESAYYKGTIVADDSTILVDGVSGRIVAPVFADVTGNLNGNVTGNVIGNVTGNVTGNLTGNSTGYHTGDVKGSLFADDSVLMVDGVDLKLSNGSITISSDTIDSLTGYINISDPTVGLTEVVVTARALSFNSVNADGTLTGGGIVRNNTSRGSLESPAAVQVGDYLSGFAMSAYNGSSFVTTGLVIAQADTVTGTETLPGKTLLAARGHNGGFVGASIDSHGVFESAVFKATPFADATARDTLLPTGVVAAGMVIFLTSTSKLQVNTNGTTGGWVDLH